MDLSGNGIMKPVIDIFKEAGRYIMRNSYWLIPAVRDIYRTIKDLFNNKKKTENGKS